MACLVRTGLTQFLLRNGTHNSLRCISTKTLRSLDPNPPKKPAPWNYEEKPYRIYNYYIDKTTSRLDDNSKIIVVEGPPAAGKTKVAKALAEEFEMLYLPEANLSMHYINRYGFDLRKLDEQLPLSCKSFDIKDFLRNPKHINAASFQILQYFIKYSQYVDALAHLLSTGQGVVLDRCCYSDFVFIEAMYSQRFISKPAYKAYYEYRDNTISELLKPHLVIYLDVPVKKTIENIQKRNLACEKNSPALTPEYLTFLEKIYKQSYLKNIGGHAETLIYDWSEGGEVEVVVEDVERINFDAVDSQAKKLKDWEMESEEEWGVARNKYADRKIKLLSSFNIPVFHVPELVISAEDVLIQDTVMDNAPGEVYEAGFNAAMGDKGLLFKTKGYHRDTLARRERILQ